MSETSSEKLRILLLTRYGNVYKRGLEDSSCTLMHRADGSPSKKSGT